ncbi:DNA polymerase III subunit epsilon [Elongatibacter sediminis]|uniref:DNA polymerase III subunit epsilon n=1 Tax=Elongatibacter sediminis TaxID=3119006 RepID=A0AAW9RDY0_9GAMM
MNRQVVLDTETTGLEVTQGHRIIEIGGVELIDRKLTGRHFHEYINPQRDIEEGALEVHGITLEFLADKPLFAEIAEPFVDFIRGAELIIHNAAFDIGFIDAELALLNDSPGRIVDFATVLDSLELARDLHPGQRNNLDALCKRYEVDDSSRTLHGALLDAELLADVYLAMTGGQEDLGLSFEARPTEQPGMMAVDRSERPPVRVLEPDAAELARHRARLEAIRERAGACLWLELEEEGQGG